MYADQLDVGCLKACRSRRQVQHASNGSTDSDAIDPPTRLSHQSSSYGFSTGVELNDADACSRRQADIKPFFSALVSVWKEAEIKMLAII